jgi:hypothetical protein
MDDVWMLEMMRKRGREDKEFSNFMKNRFTEYARGGRRGMMRHSYPDYEHEWSKPYNRYPEDMDWDDYYTNRHNDSEIYDVISNLSPEDKKRMMRMMAGEDTEHFGREQAKYLVSQMYHVENGRKHVGEKYNYDKATEVMQRYAGMIPHGTTPCDIYVAINAQYHDYGTLFKSWFGDNIDSKIMESAIIFWFKDDDYKDGSKLLNYFMK